MCHSDLTSIFRNRIFAFGTPSPAKTAFLLKLGKSKTASARATNVVTVHNITAKIEVYNFSFPYMEPNQAGTRTTRLPLQTSISGFTHLLCRN